MCVIYILFIYAVNKCNLINCHPFSAISSIMGAVIYVDIFQHLRLKFIDLIIVASLLCSIVDMTETPVELIEI